jgi:hypothetical protein
MQSIEASLEKHHFLERLANSADKQGYQPTEISSKLCAGQETASTCSLRSKKLSIFLDEMQISAKPDMAQNGMACNGR